MAKFMSWNVNGIRACESKGFLNWFKRAEADIVCVQEIKATPEQLSPRLLNPNNYHAFWNPAEKPGYSGVALFTKREPLDVTLGLGVKDIDREGRVITAEFKNYILVNAYFPNSQREHARLPFKLKFCREYAKHITRLRKKGKTLVLCADWNIAHKEIDLKNPKSNENNAGFLPEERAWMTEFLELGFIDTFRHFNPDPGHYTWWSYRPGVREKNIGWRLDYFITDAESAGRLKAAKNQPKVMGSDHCPVALEIKN